MPYTNRIKSYSQPQWLLKKHTNFKSWGMREGTAKCQHNFCYKDKKLSIYTQKYDGLQ